MKRSKHINLVLSGALATGAGLGGACRQQPPPPPLPPSNAMQDQGAVPLLSTNQTYTNNHYVPNVGYYHAPYQGWFPYPYNYYSPGWGYYHGGNWTPQPNGNTVTNSHPTSRATSSAHSTWSSSRSSGSSSGDGGSSSSSGSSTSRGGFGSSSHSTAS